MQVHIALGVLSAYAIHSYFPEASMPRLIALGIIGNLLPDIDHIFFLFWYGATTEYAKTIKKYIRSRELRNAAAFMKLNHKLNTSIYSHNVISLVLAFLLFWYLGDKRDSAALSVFFLSWCTHYLYDILEDFLFFKKINPNWFLKFNRYTGKFNEVPQRDNANKEIDNS
jgi:membrane-bound metal-dependent hydrolase YbcI (DUF457 family)